MNNSLFRNRIGASILLNVSMLLLGFLLPVGFILAADSKPAWQANWEQTVAAAKKEGKLNFYVGRYCSEPLLNEFRKEFPGIKLVTVNGSGKAGRTSEGLNGEFHPSYCTGDFVTANKALT